MTDADSDGWQPPPEGSVIRLQGEEDCEVPLWGDGELLFVEREELVRDFGVSSELADDLAAWAARRQASRTDREELDVEASRLVVRLNHELANRYRFVYRRISP